MTEFITNSREETMDIGRKLAGRLTAGTTLAFEGDLGAGKTCFITGLAEGLSFTGEVSSPTFALVNVYEGGRLPLYHFDMYRISGWEDLYSSGYYDYMETGGILAVEWSENISAALPDDAITIMLECLPDDRRKITIQGGGLFEDTRT